MPETVPALDAIDRGGPPELSGRRLREAGIVGGTGQASADDFLVVGVPREHRAVGQHQGHRIAGTKTHSAEQAPGVIQRQGPDDDTVKTAVLIRQPAAK